jgi:hypothetical protein
LCHALGETVRKQRVQRRVRQGQGALRRDCATALGLLTEGVWQRGVATKAKGCCYLFIGREGCPRHERVMRGAISSSPVPSFPHNALAAYRLGVAYHALLAREV